MVKYLMPDAPEDTEKIKKEIKEKIKGKLKKQIKKELMDEIYQELLSEEEEIAGDISSHFSKSSETKQKEQKLEAPKPKRKSAKTLITVKAVLKIASHSLKYANEKIPKDEWVEVIGLLAGKINNENVLVIEDVYPMGHGSAVNAEIKDYNNYIKAFKDIKKNNLFICGWYHSHPSYGCFMSDEDMGTQKRYQKLWKKALALVIDPYEIDGTSYGFQIFRANLRKNKWYPVSYDIKGSLDPKTLPQLVDFINPIVDGKAIYLEYDEKE
ncbi:MAG: hypothetical protein R6U96_18880 [Promethearchaeia archaeon]